MPTSKSHMQEAFPQLQASRPDGLLSKAERKRIQNRINQQAYRKREAEKAATNPQNKVQPVIIPETKPFKLVLSQKITKSVPNIARKHSGKNITIKNLQGTSETRLSQSFSQSLDDSEKQRSKADILTQEALQADLAPITTHVTSLLPNTNVTLEALNRRAHNAPVPKQVYWDWAVNHPETVPESEIQNLPCISGLTSALGKPANPAFRFPVSADHKIMIIQYNLYRAMKVNKDLLNEWLPPCPLSGTVPKIIDGLVAPCLQPTALQQVIVHPSWIAIFPHPRVRDNLILRQEDVCWDDIMADLSGYLFPYHARCDRDDHDHERPEDHDDPSDVSNGGHGMIVWGEPWDIKNWELTPSFVRKWKWLLKGCQDMVVASNKWRSMRGEPPILEELD